MEGVVEHLRGDDAGFDQTLGQRQGYLRNLEEGNTLDERQSPLAYRGIARTGLTKHNRCVLHGS